MIDYPEKVDIRDVNDEIWFDVINRTITPKVGEKPKDILVQNDANSRNIGFMMQRYFENTDLSTKNIAIHYVNSLDQHDRIEVHDVQIVGDDLDVLSFLWLVDEKVCVEAGYVEFAIEVSDENGYYWYTKPAKITVEEGIYYASEIVVPDDWYKKLFAQYDSKLDKNQGVENENKIMSVDTDGNIVAKDNSIELIKGLAEALDKANDIKDVPNLVNDMKDNVIYKQVGDVSIDLQYNTGTELIEVGELFPNSFVWKYQTASKPATTKVVNFNGEAMKVWEIDGNFVSVEKNTNISTVLHDTNDEYPTSKAVLNMDKNSVKIYSGTELAWNDDIAFGDAVGEVFLNIPQSIKKIKIGDFYFNTERNEIYRITNVFKVTFGTSITFERVSIEQAVIDYVAQEIAKIKTPTKTSELTNDSGFVNENKVNELIANAGSNNKPYELIASYNNDYPYGEYIKLPENKNYSDFMFYVQKQGHDMEHKEFEIYLWNQDLTKGIIISLPFGEDNATIYAHFYRNRNCWTVMGTDKTGMVYTKGAYYDDDVNLDFTPAYYSFRYPDTLYACKVYGGEE